MRDMKSKLFKGSLILIIPFITIVASAQELRSVSGIVTSFNHVPLNKARIVAVKSKEIVYTDSIGRFVLKCYNNDAITATASGFKSKRIKIGKPNIYTLDLLFEDKVSNFNDAVNNGHITENTLRRAIEESKLKNQKDYSKYHSIYELIANEIYDVTVKDNSVYNKKIRSFDLTPQVLYVVNGKVVSDISYVSPNDVKLIEFVDDVGSTLYGMQGANGVIKVTLK